MLVTPAIISIHHLFIKGGLKVIDYIVLSAQYRCPKVTMKTLITRAIRLGHLRLLTRSLKITILIE